MAIALPLRPSPKKTGNLNTRTSQHVPSPNSRQQPFFPPCSSRRFCICASLSIRLKGFQFPGHLKTTAGYRCHSTCIPIQTPDCFFTSLTQTWPFGIRCWLPLTPPFQTHCHRELSAASSSSRRWQPVRRNCFQQGLLRGSPLKRKVATSFWHSDPETGTSHGLGMIAANSLSIHELVAKHQK